MTYSRREPASSREYIPTYNLAHEATACLRRPAVRSSIAMRRRAVEPPERRRRAGDLQASWSRSTPPTRSGSMTKAAEAMAARLKAAGFAAADVQVLGPDPRKSNLVARYARHRRAASRSCCSRTSTSSRRSARTGRSIRSCSSRRTATSTAAARATTRRWRRSLVANLIRLKQEGFMPDRDLILALTADEEGGNFNGVDWLREEPPRSDRRRARAERRRRRSDEERQVPDQRDPGAARRCTRTSARGDERRRPQLAAGAGQRDLPPGRRARAARAIRLSGESERGDAHATSSGWRRSRRDPKVAADMRAVRGTTAGRAAVGAAVAPAPVLQRADAHDVRGDDARRAATRRTRCRRRRRRT